jgi:hypothetical protein
MKDIESKTAAFRLDLFDYAFSPLEPKYKESQRIFNPETKLKIKIIGKRTIKEENNLNIKKIYRISK